MLRLKTIILIGLLLFAPIVNADENPEASSEAIQTEEQPETFPDATKVDDKSGLPLK